MNMKGFLQEISIYLVKKKKNEEKLNTRKELDHFGSKMDLP